MGQKRQHAAGPKIECSMQSTSRLLQKVKCVLQDLKV